jgi:rhodanese-related sulfurtransferase
MCKLRRTKAVSLGAVKEIDRNQLKRLVDAGAQLVEVLPRNEYEEDHLPRAIHLPLRKIEADARTILDPTRPVIVYCWDGT